MRESARGWGSATVVLESLERCIISVLAIESRDGSVRKISKLVCHSHGGFAVVVPYHSARNGFLLKMPVDYDHAGTFQVPFSECVPYSVEDRVKLSYHPDGFVQFSGENPGAIVSGRDPLTGLAKGLGIMTNPLTYPINTGPSVGITAWGLSDYEQLSSPLGDVICFAQQEMYYRGCKPGTENAVHIEVFVFPPRYWAAVRGKGSTMELGMAFGHFEASAAVLSLKVVALENSNALLGIVASLVRVAFKEQSGFTLNGPGESTPGPTKNVLIAFYPGTILAALQRNIRDLNYKPEKLNNQQIQLVSGTLSTVMQVRVVESRPARAKTRAGCPANARSLDCARDDRCGDAISQNPHPTRKGRA